MKWKKGAKSDNVIDSRGSSSSGSGLSGGGAMGSILGSVLSGGLGKLGGGAGVVGVIIVVVIQLVGNGSGTIGGFDISNLGLDATAPGFKNPEGFAPGEDPEADLYDFSRYVFGDTQATWSKIFASSKSNYEDATMEVYRDRVSTGGCGGATSAVGPFYCPADQTVYLDLSFYEDMQRVLHADGDFAWAYVIAHEMGHHVQQLDGTSASVRRLEHENPDGTNELSVRLELQADCYAGVWGAQILARGDLEDGDIEEAFTAAEAVGDDRLQKQAGVAVDPDLFTHGTSEQRRTWFDRGFDSANPAECNTFSADEL